MAYFFLYLYVSFCTYATVSSLQRVCALILGGFLAERVGATVVECACIIELLELKVCTIPGRMS